MEGPEFRPCPWGFPKTGPSFDELHLIPERGDTCRVLWSGGQVLYLGSSRPSHLGQLGEWLEVDVGGTTFGSVDRAIWLAADGTYNDNLPLEAFTHLFGPFKEGT